MCCLHPRDSSAPIRLPTPNTYVPHNAPAPRPLAPPSSGVEVEVRPSRLGLARVSVVRGAGPGRGTACIDDYIRGVEPVYDYLTKYR